MSEVDLRIRKKRLARDFIIIGVSIAAAFILHVSSGSRILVDYFSSVYFVPSAILAGFLFSLTFTAAISTSVFILLAETNQNIFLIALLGGFGSVIGNSLIYKFFKDELVDDIISIEPEHARKIAHKIMHSKLFVGLIPYIAALLLASPLPDEVGILLLSGVKFKYSHFLFISFTLHTIGVLLIVLIGRTF